MARWMMLAVLVAFVAVAKADFRSGNIDVTNNLTVANTGTIHNLAVDYIYGNTFPGVISVEDPFVFNARATHNGSFYANALLVAYGTAEFYTNVVMQGELIAHSNVVFYGRVRMENNLRLSSMMGNGNLYVEGTAMVAGASVLTTATGVGTNDARYLGALTNAPLSAVLGYGNNAAGQSATNFADITGTKRMTLGTGFVLSDITASAVGARMMGAASGTQTIGANSAGSAMNGLNQGTRIIGATLFGAYQNGWNTGVQLIDPNSHGSEQSGWNSGSMVIGQDAPGSMQRGQVDAAAGATNNATAALQLFDLAAGQKALTTAGGDASILLGAGTSSNKNAIVAGDGQESHGDGSITAGGGFYGNGSGLTNILSAHTVTGPQSNVIANAITNSAWLWSGAQIVAVSTSAYSLAYGGPAVWNAGSNRFDLLPYSTTNYGAVTGTVTIIMASNAYLSSIGGTWYIKTGSGTTPQQPVNYNLAYDSTTSAVLSAWCSMNPADATSDYYAYFSNLVVYGYDRTDMTPYQFTNDAAGIVARVDPLPTGNTDGRRVVNSESLTEAIAAAKPDIAKEAWSYMPSGARMPSYSMVTLDKPLAQQSAGVVYVQSGNFFAQSYQGTWDATVTGSVWRVGPSGRTALEIASTNIPLNITSFSVQTNVATFAIATNSVVGAPFIEYCSDLVAGQWLYAASQSVVSNATNWTATCPTVATMLFFRAVSPGGDNRITSHYQHQFNAGLTAANIIQTSGGWDDLLFPVSSIYAVGLTDIEYLPQSNSINFKATCNTNFTSDNVWLVGQLSHSTKTNSAFISPHIHFIQTSATQTNMFFIRYKRYKTGDAVPTDWTDLPTTNNVFTYTSGALHQIAEGANIAGPFGISENFDFKIWSRGGEATQLKFFDIHFQRDSLGSDLEFRKTF